MTQTEEIAALIEQLAEAKADLVASNVEIEELKGKITDLEDTLSDYDSEPDFDNDEYYVETEKLAEVRRLIYRKQYEDAIEMADRELPARLRYAS